MTRVLSSLLFALIAGACEGALSPFCIAATGQDPATKVKFHCPLTAEEKRIFYAQIDVTQRASQAYTEAQWEASNPTKCPPRLTQPYDFQLASEDALFMQHAQFTPVSDGYGRAWQRVYVPTQFSDELLAKMRTTIAKREEMCRANGYQPAGFMPPIFGIRY